MLLLLVGFVVRGSTSFAKTENCSPYSLHNIGLGFGHVKSNEKKETVLPDQAIEAAKVLILSLQLTRKETLEGRILSCIMN